MRPLDGIVPLVSECVHFHYGRETYHPLPERGGPEVPLHVHPYHQLDLFPSGAICVFIEGSAPVRTRPWTGLLIPPMTGHGYATSRAAPQISLKFHLSPRYWLHFRNAGRLVSYPRWYGEAIRAVHGLSGTNPVMRRQELVALITLCLAHWIRGVGEEESVLEVSYTWGRRMQSLVEMLAEAPYGHWRVAALARHCHVAPDHFCRRFEDIVGKSPRRFLLELRMRAAAMSLLHKDATVKEVAIESGYADVHGFTRAFTKVFGVGPARYVKTVARLT